MRYEDWTFREADGWLGEHRELRQALGLARMPDFTTLYRGALVAFSPLADQMRRVQALPSKKGSDAATPRLVAECLAYIQR
jgi:hypothetical protein